MFIKLNVFYILTCIFIVIVSISGYSYVDDKAISNEQPRKIGWIDPYDMSFKPKPYPDYQDYTQDNKKDSRENHEESELCNNKCEVTLKRLVNSFLRSTSLLKKDEEFYDSTITLVSSIAPRDLKVLKMFAEHGRGKGDADIGNIGDIFHKIFVDNAHYGRKEASLLDKLNILMSNFFYKVAQSPELTVVSSVMAMLLATLWFAYKTHSYRMALFSLTLTLFCTGFGFTWIRLYEEAEVERFANIQLHGEVPYHCSGKPMPWYEHMYYRTFGVNCLEFFKSRDVRPISKISPTDVLSETLSSMVIKPGANIGAAYGNFCHKVLHHIPWWLKPIAIPFVFILPPVFFVLVMALFLNYRFSISLTGFHLMPSWSSRRIVQCENEGGDYVKDVPHHDSSIFSSIFSDSKTPMFLVNWSALQKLSSRNLLCEDKSESKEEKDSKHEEAKDVEEVDEEEVLQVTPKKVRQSIGYHKRGTSNEPRNSNDTSDQRCSPSTSTKNDTSCKPSEPSQPSSSSKSSETCSSEESKENADNR